MVIIFVLQTIVIGSNPVTSKIRKILVFFYKKVIIDAELKNAYTFTLRKKITLKKFFNIESNLCYSFLKNKNNFIMLQKKRSLLNLQYILSYIKFLKYYSKIINKYTSSCFFNFNNQKLLTANNYIYNEKEKYNFNLLTFNKYLIKNKILFNFNSNFFFFNNVLNFNVTKVKVDAKIFKNYAVFLKNLCSYNTGFSFINIKYLRNNLVKKNVGYSTRLFNKNKIFKHLFKKDCIDFFNFYVNGLLFNQVINQFKLRNKLKICCNFIIKFKILNIFSKNIKIVKFIKNY